ncbi:hypothetical protein Tco_0677454 [Tanacetum coccineum]|uniref:Uncharacterized protein n=1 Tax=Tanacetum coccineum TaxID=301880 RepID=A0ABQ4XDD1_9ASTR
MSKLAFCDYHNMVAILEKTEHNTDFHQIVDFLEASPLRYALLVRPTIYVSHIRQILTPSHTPTPRRLTKRAIRIAQSKALTPGADEPASPLRDDSHGEAFPTATSLDAGQDRENIPKTSAIPYELSPRVTSLGSDEGSSEQQSEGNKDVKEKDSDDHDKIKNIQQWVVLVRQESLVDITPLVVKARIYDLENLQCKDKLREVYHIFRVGQAPKAYPYFEVMLKEFDRDDMVNLWKLVKDRLWKNIQRRDPGKKCLFWPFKVMFLNPVDYCWVYGSLSTY